MILIADSGSTKTSWAVVANGEARYLYSEGLNPYYMDADFIEASMLRVFPDETHRRKIREIYFYGAGCSPERKIIMINALSACFQKSHIEVEEDLLAAARCLLGNRRGFAAILGTGTNTCFYNGEEIIETVDSLGFLAGDEGSGAYLGKQLVKAYARGVMPSKMLELFKLKYGLSGAELVSELYSSRSPNKFSAQFAIFAKENIHHPFVYSLVKSCFRDFFSEIVLHYKNDIGAEINFVGSVAFEFLEVLQSVAAGYGMTVGKVVKSPLPELVRFHGYKSVIIDKNRII